MSTVLHEIKMWILTYLERLRIRKSHKFEIKKYKAPERKKIINTVILSNEQKQKIDHLYSKNYGKKIPYTWHRTYTAYTGKFDERYFPELLYIPEFEYYMTPRFDYRYVFADKNVIPIIAKYVGIKMPELIVSKTAGIYRDEKLYYLSQEEAVNLLKWGGEMFLKPSVESSSGKKCQLVNFVEGYDKITGNSVEEICKNLGENFVAQKVIRCHESIRRLHPQSVNTFRVTTYRWKQEIRYFPILMRIGVGMVCVDNAHAGGIFVAIDEDGKLHSKAFTEFNKQFTEHPDTHIRFAGYKIEHFEQVLIAAKRLHYAIPQVGVVNWDFTINESGEAVLVEANMAGGGSLWLPEMSHGKGVFGDNTEEVLRWLKIMRKTRKDKREHIYYGETEI